MNIKNLTPHAVILRVGEKKIEIKPSGYVARVEANTRVIDSLSIEGVAIPLVETQWGKISILNSASEELRLEAGTLYIVSALVAQAATPELKAQFVVPTDFVRDEHGRIIAARALSRA